MSRVPTRIRVGPKPISVQTHFDLSFGFIPIHLILNLGVFGGPFLNYNEPRHVSRTNNVGARVRSV